MGLKHLILFFLFLSCSPAEGIPYTEPEHIYTSYEQSCITSLNIVRESNGLQPLILHNGLSELAMGHAIYLSTNKVINHNNYGIRLYDAQDMGFIGLSENIAYGYTTVDSLIAAWLKSDGHRDNLLDDIHTHHGFGISSDIYGKMYYVHIFSH